MAIGSPGSTPFGNEIIQINPDASWTDIRVAALETIGALGPAASAALPFLDQLIHDSVPEVRKAAQAALVLVRP